MKMKEVIEKTGLTDRAVRLYIDNGLVKPEISENNLGRKSIDFTDENIAALQNIAVLRKAGFSIADIKNLFSGNESALSALEGFIENCKKEVVEKNEIILKLQKIDRTKEVTVETICNALSLAVCGSKVPDEDMLHSQKDESDRKFSVILSIVFMIIPVLSFIAVLVNYKIEFKFSSLTADDLFWTLMFHIGWIFVFALSLISFLLCRKKYSFSKGHKRHRTLSEILILICFSLLIPSGIFSLAAIAFPSVYSQTTEIKNYMILDSTVEKAYGEEIKKIFPEKIPDYAMQSSDKAVSVSPYTTRYYYMYESLWDHSFDVFAEWKLTPTDFNDAVEASLDDYIGIQNKGDWVCRYYTDIEKNESDSYWYLIFAYNPKTYAVRYIASYAIDSQVGPYYKTVEW